MGLKPKRGPVLRTELQKQAQLLKRRTQRFVEKRRVDWFIVVKASATGNNPPAPDGWIIGLKLNRGQMLHFGWYHYKGKVSDGERRLDYRAKTFIDRSNKAAGRLKKTGKFRRI